MTFNTTFVQLDIAIRPTNTNILQLIDYFSYIFRHFQVFLCVNIYRFKLPNRVYVAFLILMPSYWYIGGLNIVYLYPIFLFMGYVTLQNKILLPKLKLFGNPFFVLYFLYVFFVSWIERAFLYAVASFFSVMGVFYLVITLIDSQKKLACLCNWIIKVVFVCCILGIFEAISESNFFQSFAPSGMSFFTDYRMGHLRISVQFAQPIVYCLFLILVSPVVYFRMLSTEKGRNAGFVKLTYILMIINVFLTASRAPMLAFAVLQMIFMYLSGRRSFVLKIFGGVALLILMLEVARALQLDKTKALSNA